MERACGLAARLRLDYERRADSFAGRHVLAVRHEAAERSHLRRVHAGLYNAFPCWNAVIWQSPPATGVTVFPDTVQTEGVRDVKLTGSPEVRSR